MQKQHMAHEHTTHSEHQHQHQHSQPTTQEQETLLDAIVAEDSQYQWLHLVTTEKGASAADWSLAQEVDALYNIKQRKTVNWQQRYEDLMAQITTIRYQYWTLDDEWERGEISYTFFELERARIRGQIEPLEQLANAIVAKKARRTKCRCGLENGCTSMTVWE